MTSPYAIGSNRQLPRIGTRLRELLDARFITHEEFAHAIGVRSGTVSRWARGETGPQKRRLRQVAEYFSVEPATLIEPDPDERPAS